MPNLLKPQETADIYRISIRTLRQWTAKGLIRAVRIGGCVRYDAAEIERAVHPAANQPTGVAR